MLSTLKNSQKVYDHFSLLISSLFEPVQDQTSD